MFRKIESQPGAPIPVSIQIPENPTTGQISGLTVPDPFTAQFSFSPAILIESNCSIDMVSLSIPYTVPNVVPPNLLPGIIGGNNRITISFGGPAADFLFPQGLYSYNDIAYQLNSFAATAAWCSVGAQLFIVTPVQATQTLIITVNPLVILAGAWGVAGQVPALNIILNFVNPSPVTGLNDSIGQLLGYGTGVGAIFSCVPGATSLQPLVAPNVADFAKLTAILINIPTLVTSSYLNGAYGNLLFALPLGSYTPNSIASYQTSLRYPVPAQPGKHSQVQIFFSDNLGNRIPLSLFQGNININFVVSKNKSDGSL